MNILVIGSGGREHALCWKIKQSPLTEALYAIPGNAGIANVAECIPFITIDDHEAIVNFAVEKSIDLVVIGPEAPLVAGLTNTLESKNIAVFGPSAEAARLEASKGFTKDLCTEYNIPTAKYEIFIHPAKAKAFVDTLTIPVVIKADGLAAGKGVIIAQTKEEAYDAIDDVLGGKFGTAGSSLIVEEFLEGEEISFFALSDGTNVLPFGSAQDHKRVGEGDTGPNTGGMGAYSPAPIMTESLYHEIMETIIQPTITAMKERGCPFKGVLFAGIMVTKSGPQLLEFNVRFGDPETQCVLSRLQSDLVPALQAAANGDVTTVPTEWADHASICVVMAANGYPDSYKKGSVISGLDALDAQENLVVFHAGTSQDGENIIATGGRVLGVTALGENIITARHVVYDAIDQINWPEGFYRKDIAWRAVDYFNTLEKAAS